MFQVLVPGLIDVLNNSVRGMCVPDINDAPTKSAPSDGTVRPCVGDGKKLPSDKVAKDLINSSPSPLWVWDGLISDLQQRVLVAIQHRHTGGLRHFIRL